MNKQQVLEKLQTGVELYFTQYETSDEVREHAGNPETITQIKELPQYYGESFEHNDIEIVDGDWIYEIVREGNE